MTPFAQWLRLVRPKQWAKSAFVLIGPAYGLREAGSAGLSDWWPEILAAAIAFALASSACYIVNDIQDAEADRLHPRKSKRPIASGAISAKAGIALACGLAIAAALACGIIRATDLGLFATLLGLYVANTLAYSSWLKHFAVLDVMSLAMGFVLRVLAGCAAVGIEPSAWLLNSTFFLSLFLAIGKRLGERRTLDDAGVEAGLARAVHRLYTPDILRMMVVVTGVATLLTYAGYVQDQSQAKGAWLIAGSIHALWLTMLPATFALLRAILLLEQGRYDDPTELAYSDKPTLLAAGIFAAITLAIVMKASASIPQ